MQTVAGDKSSVFVSPGIFIYTVKAGFISKPLSIYDSITLALLLYFPSIKVLHH